MDVQSIKLRFEIIGNSTELNRAIDIARQVAATDLSVLVNGESGTGKEVFPKIIHNLSARKHGAYIAVNCGAIPEGTIDSELFGHEKGSFTGAHEARKGYFEVANGGTIFLDEVAELPLQTQVRLLRLNTVPIIVPPLRTRNTDILMLFAKFSIDFAERYRMPAITLDESAQQMLINYRWPGNIRQLKNVTEQASVIEKGRILTSEGLSKYLHTDTTSNLPVLLQKEKMSPEMSERDILYKVLFDMKNDINELKKIVFGFIENPEQNYNSTNEGSAYPLHKTDSIASPMIIPFEDNKISTTTVNQGYIHQHEIIEESLSLQDQEIDMIKKALQKHSGKRKNAAKELGISERTLYRKIKENNIK